MNKRLSFVHIPKTGGSYTRKMLKGDNFYDTERHGFFGANPPFDSRINDYTKIHKHRDLSKISNYSKLDFFAIVRNPFDMLYSYYSHTRENYGGWAACNEIHDIDSFEDFVNKYCDPNFKWHYPAFKKMLFTQMFLPQGKCIPKYVIRHDYLNKGLRKLCHDYDIDYNENKFGKINVSTKSGTYFDAYTEDMKSQVYSKCKFELKMFGYDFDGPTDNKTMLDVSKLTYKWR
jgi:hypothetical protein